MSRKLSWLRLPMVLGACWLATLGRGRAAAEPEPKGH